MAGRSFKDEELVRFSRAFVPVLVDADAHPEAKKKYGVSRLPAVRFTKNDGTQLTGVEGNQRLVVEFP